MKWWDIVEVNSEISDVKHIWGPMYLSEWPSVISWTDDLRNIA